MVRGVSRALNETPDVCSPSRSVVSTISTERTIGPVLFAGGFERPPSGRRYCAGSPRRREPF